MSDEEAATASTAPETAADAGPGSLLEVIGDGAHSWKREHSRQLATRAHGALVDELAKQAKTVGAVLTALESRGLLVVSTVGRDAVGVAVQASPGVIVPGEAVTGDHLADGMEATPPRGTARGVHHSGALDIVSHSEELDPSSTAILLTSGTTCPSQLRDLAATARATQVVDVLRAAVSKEGFEEAAPATRENIQAAIEEAADAGRQRWVLIIGPTVPGELLKGLVTPDGAVVRLEDPLDARLARAVGGALLITASSTVAVVWRAWDATAEVEIADGVVTLSTSERRRVARVDAATPTARSTRFAPATHPVPDVASSAPSEEDWVSALEAAWHAGAQEIAHMMPWPFRLWAKRRMKSRRAERSAAATAIAPKGGTAKKGAKA